MEGIPQVSADGKKEKGKSCNGEQPTGLTRAVSGGKVEKTGLFYTD